MNAPQIPAISPGTLSLEVPESTPPKDRRRLPLADVAFPKTIKSYVKRAGRTTSGQTKAFEDLGPRFILPFRPNAINFEALYSENTWADGVKQPEYQSNVLEIGFGMGEATAHIAARLPQTRFLCCEVHEPGVGALLKRIGEQDLNNIRILQHDAVEVLDHMLPLHSLDGIHIFFPDPWHKTKHHKRRLIQGALVAKLAARLKPGGYLHCATDWEPYAQQMLDVLGAEPNLKNSSVQATGFADKPDYRPLTKFENRGLKLGHGVWDLVFIRV